MRHDWDTIRDRAQAERRAALCRISTASASALLSAAIEAPERDVTVQPTRLMEKGVNGQLIRSTRVIRVRHDLPATRRHFVIAHELGHYLLHRDEELEKTAIRYAIDEETMRIGGYSPRERLETQADVFACEFLCPQDVLRQFLDAGLSLAAIARLLDVELDVVLAQALQVLRPAQHRYIAPSDVKPGNMSIFSGEAALLLEGGPGCGKTARLAAEVDARLARGTPPAKICLLARTEGLALAIKDRLRTRHNLEEMWIGTLVGLAYELIAQFPAEHAREAPTIIDRTSALELVAQGSPVQLDPKQTAACLDLVKRAKMAGCSYETAFTEDAALRSHVSKADFRVLGRAYDQLLAKRNSIDTEDVLAFATKRLVCASDILDYAARFRFFAVDDLHEAPAAAAAFLAALAATGCQVLATSSPLPPLYAYRGLSRETLQTFLKIPGAQKLMLPAKPAGSGRIVLIARSTTLTGTKALASAIIERILADQRKGGRLKDHVVLARSHRELEHLQAEVRRDRRLTTLFLGDLWKRPEIATCLAVLRLLNKTAKKQDVAILLNSCLERTAAAVALRALAKAVFPVGFEDLQRLSQTGKRWLRCALADLVRRLEALLVHKGSFRPASVFAFETLLHGQDQAGARRPEDAEGRLALYHFLQVCREHDAAGDPSLEALVRRLKKMGSNGQDTAYSQRTYGEIDAVQFMTIHQFAGQSRRCVHLVDQKGRARAMVRKPPTNLIGLGPEDAIMLTGLTRAYEVLYLYPSCDPRPG